MHARGDECLLQSGRQLRASHAIAARSDAHSQVMAHPAVIVDTTTESAEFIERRLGMRSSFQLVLPSFC